MNVSSQNIGVFPKIDSFSTTQLVKYVAHFGPIIKVIYISTPKYPNHICSISSDQRLKLWTLNNPYTCLKTLNLEFMICDIIQGNNDCVLVSGEKIANIDLNTQKIIYIIQPKIGHFIEFSKLSKINEQYAVSSSLNKFYLIFDINNGKIKKRIKMNQVHFICWMEKNLREKKELLQKENEENNKKGIKEEEEEEEEEEDDNEIAEAVEVLENYNKKLENENDINIQKSKKKIKKKKIEIRDIGSAFCLETKEGHKGYVTSMISINSKDFPNSIISGAYDNMIKIINIDNDKIIDLKGHDNTVISLCLVNNKFLFSGSLDHTFKKWDLSLRECVNSNDKHNSVINNICQMKDGYILSTGYDLKIRVWDDNLGNIKTFSYNHGRIDTCCSINGELFIFGNTKSDIYIKKFVFGENNNNNNNMENSNDFMKTNNATLKSNHGNNRYGDLNYGNNNHLNN